jgi:CheY-like chemotaxis protein
MEPMDGLETTARIRAREAELANHQRIPIIALTANAAPGDNEQYLRQGMDFYLTKRKHTLSNSLPHYLTLFQQFAYLN